LALSNGEIPVSVADKAAIASAGVAFLSMVGSGVGWLLARKEKRAAAEHERQALKAAQSAAGHAKRSADAEERVAAAAESQERRTVSERAAFEQFPWKLLPIPGRDNCTLHNTSRAVLYAVEVHGQKIAHGPIRFDAFGPGQQEEVSIWRVVQMNDDVLITWQIEDEDEAEWFSQPLKVPSRIG
jgi:cbb3-type cytochrome oxidase subunit 3